MLERGQFVEVYVAASHLQALECGCEVDIMVEREIVLEQADLFELAHQLQLAREVFYLVGEAQGFGLGAADAAEATVGSHAPYAVETDLGLETFWVNQGMLFLRQIYANYRPAENIWRRM